jgi:Mg2+ and Co2+ transporter CorA
MGLDIMLQAYTQSIPVRETEGGKQGGEQIGFFTSLPTTLIPLSFVVAVFSMGGEYSAGLSLFWVYWVIAIPLAGIWGILLLTRFGRRILRRVS